MTIDPANGASASWRANKTTSAAPKRINVAVSAEMVAALDNVIQHEGVTLTEACRRLIGYGDFIYRMAKQERPPSLCARLRGPPKNSSSFDTQGPSRPEPAGPLQDRPEQPSTPVSQLTWSARSDQMERDE